MNGNEARRRICNEPGHAHFVTFSCYQRRQLLVSNWSRQLVCDSLAVARDRLGFEIWAYVIMPEHVHVLVWPRPQEYDLGRFLGFVKQRVSLAVKERLIEQGNDDWLAALTVTHGGAERFRFWQKGGGFDKNVWSESVVETVVDYVHENPCRRGLVERPVDWKWSSAAWFDGDREDVPLKIDPIRW